MRGCGDAGLTRCEGGARIAAVALRYGQPAPEFSLPSSLGRPVALADFRGQADVVVAFFCYAWGGI